MGNLGLAGAFVALTYLAAWISRRPFKRLDGILSVGFRIIAILLALTGATLVAATPVAGWLHALGTSWPIIGWIFGLGVIALPFVITSALLPSWPLDVSDILLTGILLSASLQTFAWGGSLGALSVALTGFGQQFAQEITANWIRT
jgi:hypothetical protein